MPIPLKLQVFEGPMDLLMHLIEKNKIDIYDIPIVTITDQYLEYVRQMEHDDMNVTSEFLVMAATLLDIKSRMLLPREEEEDGEEGDPRDELVRRLLEYKMFKYMSEELKEKNRHAGFTYFKPQDLPSEVRNFVPPLDYEELIGDRTAQSLQDVFRDVLKRKKSRVDPIRSGFGKIQREEINVADKQLYVRAYLETHPHADFREMLELEDSKEEIIVTFLVILELMKAQKIKITQDEAFGKILIDLVEPGQEESGEAEPVEMPEEEPAEEAEPVEEVESVEEPSEEAAPVVAEFVEDTAEEDEPMFYEKPAELGYRQRSEAIISEPLSYEEPATAAEPSWIEDLPESAPESETDPELILAPEPEAVAEDTIEAEPLNEASPGPEPADEPAPEQEPVNEPVPAPEPQSPRRRLITRPRFRLTGPGRHAFPLTARRLRKNMFRIARGNRIWSRRRHMHSHLARYRHK